LLNGKQFQNGRLATHMMWKISNHEHWRLYHSWAVMMTKTPVQSNGNSIMFLILYKFFNLLECVENITLMHCLNECIYCFHRKIIWVKIAYRISLQQLHLWLHQSCIFWNLPS
jgi:hypothetical protein